MTEKSSPETSSQIEQEQTQEQSQEQSQPDRPKETPSENVKDQQNNLQEKQVNLQEQHVNLKLEVEEIYRRVDKLRGLLQTLVSGLLVATLIAIGIASWFAYRLLLQEKIAKQENQKTLETQNAILDRLDVLEEQINGHDRQIQKLREQIPQDISTLLEEDRQQLQQLREQIEQLQGTTSEENTNDNN